MVITINALYEVLTYLLVQLNRDVSEVDLRSVGLQSAFEPELQLISSAEALTQPVTVTTQHPTRPNEPLVPSQTELTQPSSQVSSA